MDSSTTGEMAAIPIQADHISNEFKDIMMENEILAKENRLFHVYLHRNMEGISDEQFEAYREQYKIVNEDIPLSLKFAMALQEHEIRSADAKSLQQTTSRDTCLLQAILESLKVRIDLLRKDTYQFQRDVMSQNGDSTGKSSVKYDTVLQFWKNKIEEKRQLVAKYNHKTAALAAQKQKLAQSHRKKKSGANYSQLHQNTDYHELQIKNQQLASRIKDLNNELFRVKSLTGVAAHHLTTCKTNLNSELARGEELKALIQEKKQMTVRLREEKIQVHEESSQEKAKHSRFKIQQHNPDMPHVLDYIGQKALVTDLKHQVANWERKIEIANVNFQQCKLQYQRQSKQGTLELPSINKKNKQR